MHDPKELARAAQEAIERGWTVQAMHDLDELEGAIFSLGGGSDLIAFVDDVRGLIREKRDREDRLKTLLLSLIAQTEKLMADRRRDPND